MLTIKLGDTLPPANDLDIDAEKLRRLDTFFPFMGKLIQNDADSRENIAGAKSAGMDAQLLNAQRGDYSWQKLIDPNGVDVFQWITMDNTLLKLDAFDVVQMGYAAMTFKQTLIFKARAIKDRIASGEIIRNVQADELWQ